MSSLYITTVDHLTFDARELSKGHFSDDNQKRLTGSDNEIPIFEAKMTSDSRLVVSFRKYELESLLNFT